MIDVYDSHLRVMLIKAYKAGRESLSSSVLSDKARESMAIDRILAEASPNGVYNASGFYGPREPLFKKGDRVRVRLDCQVAGRLSAKAGETGVIVEVNPSTPKSRYLIEFDKTGSWPDLWCDNDLLAVE